MKNVRFFCFVCSSSNHVHHFFLRFSPACCMTVGGYGIWVDFTFFIFFLFFIFIWIRVKGMTHHSQKDF
uniref:Uncharacterized protein n=1 Tax=Anguilla anguilla TaxID=7936 RepID=A0A0E9RZ52_ANGAN